MPGAVGPGPGCCQRPLPSGQGGSMEKKNCLYLALFSFSCKSSSSSSTSGSSIIQRLTEKTVGRGERTSDHPLSLLRNLGRVEGGISDTHRQMGRLSVLSSPSNSITTGVLVPHRKAAHCSHHLHYIYCSLLSLLIYGRHCLFEDLRTMLRYGHS